MITPEIRELIHQVEKQYGKCLNTTTDFEVFSLHLDRDEQIGLVSPSTLKRLWGYVNDTRKPRTTTLDILSRFIGHQSFQDFVSDLKTSIKYNSSFFSARQVLSAELSPGDELEIGWAPNRLLRLEYLGESNFVVVKAANSKILAGDRFMCGSFILETPLFLPYILREEEKTPPFVAGRNGGLTCLKLIRK